METEAPATDSIQSNLNRLVRTLEIPIHVIESELRAASSVFEETVSSSERAVLVRTMVQTDWYDAGMTLMIVALIRHLERDLGTNVPELIRVITEKSTIVGLLLP